MATQTAGSKTDTTFIPSAEETVERIRTLNEKVIESAKTAGNASLDAYEKSLRNLLDFETRTANATQQDWVGALAKAHTRFVADITGAYTNAARELLK